MGESAFEAVSGAIKDLLIDLTKAVLKAAALYLIFTVIGGGATSFGSFLGMFSSLTSLIPKNATGGVYTRPTLALIGEQGPERVLPVGSSMARSGGSVLTGDVVFTINGNELRGVLRRANSSANNTF